MRAASLARQRAADRDGIEYQGWTTFEIALEIFHGTGRADWGVFFKRPLLHILHDVDELNGSGPKDDQKNRRKDKQQRGE